ncbi:MAG: nucleotidyltransferase family protein [Methanocorpusculum parvum]|nr:nucleotidyltransferase family protein [Methanocorpusculum parvum]
MTEYESIKEDVLAKLEAHLPELRERFGIETIGIFGSVSRGEDRPESDVDVLYTFRPGESTLANLVSLGAYLEDLFGRKVALIAERSLSPYIRSEVIAEVVMI